MNSWSLLFQTGFEPPSRGLPADAHEVLTGVGQSGGPPDDWAVFNRHLPPSHPWSARLASRRETQATAAGPRLGYFDIQYLGGTIAERFARVIEDPTCPGNHVLHFCIMQANERYPGGAKARVQACIYENRDVTALCSRVRLYLHPDLAALREWDVGFNWLTLQEYWFDPGWAGGEHTFRISLGLCREPGAGRKELHFNIHGQPVPEKGATPLPRYSGWDRPTWEHVARDFAVSTGVWMECETGYRMGDADTGRFWFRVRPQGGDWKDVFTVNDWTCNPRSAGPQPLYGWNPMKLYTSSALVDYVRARGGRPQVYWDDFSVRAGTRPDQDPSPGEEP